MVADDPVARPAPEKLAAVVEVHEVTPDGPCRALDLVGGAPPSAEQGDVTPPHRGPGLAGRAFLKRSPSRELRGLPDLEPAADAPRKPPPVKSPPRPARALGAAPPLRCRQLGIDVSFQAREASEPTTPGDLRSLAKFWEYDMVTDKERSSLASLAAVSSQATRGTVPQRIKTLASLRESGKLSEVPTSPRPFETRFPGTRRTP